jgi:acetyl-CoA acetyltransferase
VTKGSEIAIVGVGSSDYYRRGRSLPLTNQDLAIQAIRAALDDAGLAIDDVDGFAYYSGGGGLDTGRLAQTLGIPNIRFSAGISSGGNGSAASVGLAAGAIQSRHANVVVAVMVLQQAAMRFGAVLARQMSTPSQDFLTPYGNFAPGHYFALVAKRHMHEYGTTREHLFEICRQQREYASTRPKALYKAPLTHEDYFNARMIAEPLCLYDFTVECDAAAAVVITSAERARDLRQRPVYLLASAMGGEGRWGEGMSWMGMDDDLFTTAGVRAMADELYGRAGITPGDVDVAEFYDHFSVSVLLQLEDYGFCDRGESGPFVAEGNLGLKGKMPVNTNGGHLSEIYIIGMTQVVEAVEQVRGTAINQVPDAEVALATGGPSHIPVGAILLGR